MAGFPNSPVTGDSYTLGDKNWEWNGELWRIKTTGAVGPQGNQGRQGIAGTNGTNGAQGNQGFQGIAGSNGTNGTQGNQGRQGAQGPSGAPDLTYSGTKPSTPDAGDMWFDSDNGVFYVYLNDGNSSQWVEIVGDKGDSISISSSSGFTGDFLFANGSTAYKNSLLVSDSDGIPLIYNYGEQAFDNGTANNSAGQTFSINLNNGLIHYANLTTGSTSYTYAFSITGYSESSTSFALILRGGQDITVSWNSITWSNDSGAPDFSSATAGVYSVIPFYRMTTPNVGWLGGSVTDYNP